MHGYWIPELGESGRQKAVEEGGTPREKGRAKAAKVEEDGILKAEEKAKEERAADCTSSM